MSSMFILWLSNQGNKATSSNFEKLHNQLIFKSLFCKSNRHLTQFRIYVTKEL